MSPLRPESFYRGPMDKARTAIKGMIRRATVLASDNGLWQTEGFEGEQEDSVETFGVGGFYSRPESNDAEVLIVKVAGGTSNGVIVATRDETARQALAEAKDLAAGETIMFNQAGSYIHLKADGTINMFGVGDVNVEGTSNLNLSGGANKLVRGTSFISAMQVWGSALLVVITATGAGPGAALTAAIATYTTAHGVFFGALSSYLSTRSGTG